MNRWLASAALVAVLATATAATTAAEDSDWPCVQRKVPTISAGQVWTGPSLETVGDAWRQDADVIDLARLLASRRTGTAEADAEIADFAAAGDRERRLTMLFAALLSSINTERASIMAGIGRYARRQQALAEKIEAQSAELTLLPDTGGSEDQAYRREELLEIQAWDARIFQERERSLTYVCELPVALEKRAFALGKAIAAQLGD